MAMNVKKNAKMNAILQTGTRFCRLAGSADGQIKAGGREGTVKMSTCNNLWSV
jgi:hypothetical protein